MKNITVSVSDDVYRSARIKAAENDTSVSMLVTGFLKNLAGQKSEFEVRKEKMNELFSRKRTFKVGAKISRDKLHDRKSLR
ncbi:hypothetical protein QPK87_13025 [Kamptonema cortianum]|uniref:Antitoxin n=1 Tax=Geitlerinema calcuttense NRMC-F 0142 TaxID=2922238 RepID=A0ABT7LY37_9CYAN|nr:MULTISPECIES: hypothetical protein [Cyanophyceae]MDK3157491.1 hypothetical protein [Kamptonema cortianum]MDL5052605.1 hypothetical protein [Oscillatoria laete-virens NRMC-F 0139]MDL5056908.1 hypothetical protein [Geitlerinema calcuttense NRMC-F 0142]